MEFFSSLLMGETTKPVLKVQFHRRVQVEFRGATITADGGLLAARQLSRSTRYSVLRRTPSWVFCANVWWKPPLSTDSWG